VRCHEVVPSPPVLPRSPDAVVNLLHLKLFHHFETCTRQTLLFTREAWGRALQLCFEYEFLMNAILCVSARHLAAVKPEDPKYAAVAASHLCKALAQFRYELSNNFTSTDIDAFVAMSMLLQFEIWTNTDSLRDGTFDPSRECFFSHSASLKQVFLKALPLILNHPSVFLPHLQQNPMVKLVEAAQISNSTLAKYQDFFSSDHQLNAELLQPPAFTRGTDLANVWEHGRSQMDGFAPIINHICLILSFLPEAEPDAVTPLLPQLASYIVSFPVLCRGFFALKVHQSNPHALLLLYHFYRAVRILLPPDECWWAQKRATTSETILKEWLIRESVRQSASLNPD